MNTHTSKATQLILLLTLLAGCSSDDSRRVDSALKNPAAVEALAAQKYLTDLHKSGQLPGFSSNDHGQMTSGSVPLAYEALYPFSVTYHFVKKGDSSTNNYTALRLSKDSPWQLQRAWKTDSQGGTTEEWPVK